MINQFEFYHGAVFARLFHLLEDGSIAVKRYPTADNAAYVLNNKVGLYVKYSGKRMPPWRFSFQKRHQDELREMKDVLGEVFLVLVCNDDGIVALSFDETKLILDEIHDEVEWVSASRKKRTMYSVAGSNGELAFKIAMDDFPRKVIEYLEGPDTRPLSP